MDRSTERLLQATLAIGILCFTAMLLYFGYGFAEQSVLSKLRLNFESQSVRQQLEACQKEHAAQPVPPKPDAK